MEKLAIDGGAPAITQPLNKEFPGAYWIGCDEEEAVLRVVRSQSLFRFYGPDLQREVDKFEEAAKEYFGVKYALGLNSGSGALLIAMAALGVGPGDEVIVPAFMWIAIVSAVVGFGAVPVLCEVDDTYNMDVEDLKRKITPRTKAIIPVHMCGVPVRTDEIVAIARERGIKVVEDSAQANGSEVDGRKSGTIGDIGIYSLQLNKNMTTGEGGLAVTNDELLFSRLFAAHDLGFPRVDGRIFVGNREAITWGQGRRMSELAGALAVCQIKKLDAITGSMREAKQRIKKRIREVNGLRFRRIPDGILDSGPFLITIYENAGTARKFTDALNAEGLQGTMWLAEYGMHCYYNMVNLVDKIPISKGGYPWNHPANQAIERDYSKGTCSQTDDILARGVLSPVPSIMTAQQEEEYARAFIKIAEAYL